MAVSTIPNNYAFSLVDGSSPLTIPSGWNEAVIDCTVGNAERAFNFHLVKTGMVVGTSYTYRTGYYVSSGNYGAVYLTVNLQSGGSCTVTVGMADIGGTDYISSTWVKVRYR